MTTPNNLSAELASYLSARDREHAEEITQALDSLTEREQALVREAAVMGYVRGAIGAGGVLRANIPPDTEVLREVVGACLGRPDLYPTIARGETR
jgi:hypothetical protein